MPVYRLFLQRGCRLPYRLRCDERAPRVGSGDFPQLASVPLRGPHHLRFPPRHPHGCLVVHPLAPHRGVLGLRPWRARHREKQRAPEAYGQDAIRI